MSFTKNLKTELCQNKMPECCTKALCYALLLFGQSFNLNKISCLSDNNYVLNLYCSLIYKLFGITPHTEASGGKRPMYKAFIESETDRAKIISFFCGQNNPEETVNYDFLNKTCCKNSFMRGVFLACGQASDPKREYRIEFRIKNPELSFILFDFFYKRNLEPKITLKGITNVIYFKKSECVEDFFTMLGATSVTLELMDIKIMKDLRTNINRRNNYELANTSRAIEASIIQRAAIKRLMDNGKFETLPEELQEIALLRTANPEASLTDLCKLSPVSITRSGMNHRLQRIVAAAQSLNKEE